MDMIDIPLSPNDFDSPYRLQLLTWLLRPGDRNYHCISHQMDKTNTPLFPHDLNDWLFLQVTVIDMMCYALVTELTSVRAIRWTRPTRPFLLMIFADGTHVVRPISIYILKGKRNGTNQLLNFAEIYFV